MAIYENNLSLFFKCITDAIRLKTGSTDKINHRNIDDEIKNIISLNERKKAISWVITHGGKRTDYTGALSNTTYWCDDGHVNNCYTGFFTDNELKDLILDTSNGTNFSNMFEYVDWSSFPIIDTSNGTNFSFMFSGNRYVVTVPEIDTSNGTIFSGMFSSCSRLVNLPNLDTSKGVTFDRMFLSCNSLKIIPFTLSFKNVKGRVIDGFTPYSRMFEGCKKLESLTFEENSITAKYHYGNLDIHYSQYLSEESVNSIIKGLCINETNTKWTLALHSDVINKLTDEQVLEVTNKNWELG